MVKIKITTTPLTYVSKKNTHHIAEGCRHQMEISSLDCNIDADKVVRFIDAFVCKLDLQKLNLKEELLLGYFKLREATIIVYGDRYGIVAVVKTF